MGNTAAVTVCVMLATVMQALDTTIANVALPYMQGSLAATTEQINWVLTSYIVAAAIMTPPTGWLAGRLGRKRLLAGAVAGFTVASVLCGIAGSLEQMVVFRLLQGVFGAPLVPLSQSVLLDAYPRERHGQAMALWGVGVMVGPIMGPLLGGWLTEYYHWRWVFFINLPVGIAAFAGLTVFLHEPGERSRGGAFDWFGFAALSIAIGALQMMLDRGEQLDWFASREIVAEAVVSALAFYLFVVHIATSGQPFIEPRMFRDRNFSAGLAFIFIVGVILLGTLALLTPFVQVLLDWPVFTAGMVLAPRGVGTMVAMLMVGRVIGRVDPRLLIAAGLLLTALSLWEMSGFTTDVGPQALVRTGIVQGLGLGFLFVPLSTVTFATLDPRYRGHATALFSLMRNVGASIGISVAVFLLARNTQVMHAGLAETVTPFTAALRAGGAADIWSVGTRAGLAALNAEVTRQAGLVAYLDDFRLMMIVALAALPLVLLLRKPTRRTAAAVVE
ncbi:MAG: DHA2 family efflux MFS transporter permease subunit [Magnetospirillum sp.]|nr:DHA2 family efflux MFS transporter permease subunit [Magnetospirillum sp.]